MADRPILFSGPMVLALLAGSKTQTRRILPRPTNHFHADYIIPHVVDGGVVWSNGLGGLHRRNGHVHRVGDRLWVREDFCFDVGLDGEPPRNFLECTPIRYLADGATTEPPPGRHPFETAGRRRASMHMPRRFSRITLDVAEVRIERLQSISDADALAEGIYQQKTGMFSAPGFNGAGTTARAAYALLWNRINGAGTWNMNPWVAVYTFVVHRRNIDVTGKDHG